MHEALNHYPVIVECPVEWGHMDALRHVNNVVYFRYFENARIVYGGKIGIADRIESAGIGPILAHTECRYIRPLTFPDTALVGVRALSAQGSELIIKYKIVSRAQDAVAATGKSMSVFYDYRNLHRLDMPHEMLARIDQLEGRPIPRQHAV